MTTAKKLGNPNLVKGGPSLNPKGRPKGSLNSKTQMQNALIESFSGELEREFTSVVKAVIKKAKSGDMTAAKILLDRAVPVRKSVEHYNNTGDGSINIVIAPLPDGVNPLKLEANDAVVVEGETYDVDNDDNDED